ncbi:hypothetical protein KI387_006403 [Taxus chinensis]|uniref:RING-type domain-containing protein n=1 Tax=Taxus chinensis TaxID=29808 RepID=A0AA38LKU7_TAXCH|nr:hypothetical protein KI387_006403 [Taxus chinensis]
MAEADSFFCHVCSKTLNDEGMCKCVLFPVEDGVIQEYVDHMMGFMRYCGSTDVPYSCDTTSRRAYAAFKEPKRHFIEGIFFYKNTVRIDFQHDLKQCQFLRDEDEAKGLTDKCGPTKYSSGEPIIARLFGDWERPSTVSRLEISGLKVKWEVAVQSILSGKTELNCHTYSWWHSRHLKCHICACEIDQEGTCTCHETTVFFSVKMMAIQFYNSQLQKLMAHFIESGISYPSHGTKDCIVKHGEGLCVTNFSYNGLHIPSYTLPSYSEIVRKFQGFVLAQLRRSVQKPEIPWYSLHVRIFSCFTGQAKSHLEIVTPTTDLYSNWRQISKDLSTGRAELIFHFYAIRDAAGGDWVEYPEDDFVDGTDSSMAAAKIIVDTLTSSVIHGGDTDCTICLAGINNGETSKILPCEHEFHAECLDNWLAAHNQCPLCKYQLLTEEGYFL